MGEAANRNGVAYSLTVIAPILAGHEEELREHIESLPKGRDSPLARLGDLHFSRIHIFRDLVYQGEPQKPDALKGSHLVFTSSFDGDLSTYLAAVCDRLGEDADAWWRHCTGYPGTADRAEFERWIRDHQADSAMFTVAYPEAKVADVLDSLALRERIVEFAAAAQGAGAAELQRRFLAEFADR
jgi:hypothetical protein